MQPLKQPAQHAAFLAAHAYLFGAWKAGSAGAGNLFIALVAFNLVIHLLVLVMAASARDALPPQAPPVGFVKLWRVFVRWCWLGLAGVLVWHGHFVLAGMQLVALVISAAVLRHVERLHQEPAHG